MRLHKVTGVALFASYAYALPRSVEKRSIIEHTSRLPDDWDKKDRHDTFGNHVIPLKIALKQSNLDRLDEELLKVSDPDSEHYAQHWSPKDIASYFQPAKETVSAVQSWLHDSGIHRSRHEVSNTKGWIHINVTISDAEKLLHTEYHPLEHSESGNFGYGCFHYSVPEYVREHVDFIMPTLPYKTMSGYDRLGGPLKHSKRNVVTDPFGTRIVDGVGQGALYAGGPNHDTNAHQVSPDSPLLAMHKIYKKLNAEQTLAFTKDFPDNSYCWDRITPSCLFELYNVPQSLLEKPQINTDPKTPPLAVVEYSPESLNKTDVIHFEKIFNISRKQEVPDIVHASIGNVTSLGSLAESNLDVQYTVGVAPKLNVTLYEVGNFTSKDDFNLLLDALDGSYCDHDGGDDPVYDDIYHGDEHTCGGQPVAQVISTSYGLGEVDVSDHYMQRQCAEYGKLSLAGTTFLFSSGDSGVGDRGTCLKKNGSVSLDYVGRFAASFPASCPYVTAVGATAMVPFANTSYPEQACENVIYSGGGFSDIYGIPKWQSKTLSKWKKDHKPAYPDDVYNQTSRGIPDVSANGASYVITEFGFVSLIYGTSASTPVVASFIALINNARAEKGKNPVGFINPTLYSKHFKDAFNDITAGTNPGCGTEGFEAVTGWDPVTGLGTPKVDKWLDIFLSLP